MSMMVVEGEATATDYAVVTGAYSERDSNSSRPVEWFEPAHHIHGDLWLSTLSQELCTALLDASERRGENWNPYRQYGCTYAFYRVNAPAGPQHDLEFDNDHALQRCIQFSRLVHPTSAGFEHAVRVREWRNGARQIVPVCHSYMNPHAFVTDPNENWLLPRDLPDIATLIEAALASPPKGRIASALWHYETLSREYYVDVRWPLLTTCLESLVRIKDEKHAGRFAGSRKVFVDRLLAIGVLDPTLAVTEQELVAMYDQRSLLAHGLAFGSLDEARKTLYRTQERLARGIMRKALLDPAFRDTFSTDAKLGGNLPLR